MDGVIFTAADIEVVCDAERLQFVVEETDAGKLSRGQVAKLHEALGRWLIHRTVEEALKARLPMDDGR